MKSNTVRQEGMTDLQALVTGIVAAALMRATGQDGPLSASVNLEHDEDGWLPELTVRGANSGDVVIVKVINA